LYNVLKVSRDCLAEILAFFLCRLKKDSNLVR